MRSRALSSVLVLATVVVAVVAASPALADGPPYNDPTASGSITLCDQDLKSITSGSVDTRPFVWRAVGSESAPPPYNSEGRRAALYVFQPREGVPPGEWNGTLATAASTYTNPKHPIAQATLIDFSLAPAIKAFPPRWDGWLQLRLYYTAPLNPVSTQYAAASIQVKDDLWRLVDGGRTACDVGDAVSPELLLPYYSKSARAVVAQQQRRDARASAQASASASTPQETPGASSGGDTTTGATGAAGVAGQTSGFTLLLWALLIVVAAGALTVGAAYLLRRRESLDGRHR